jgi:hypothetical protein
MDIPKYAQALDIALRRFRFKNRVLVVMPPGDRGFIKAEAIEDEEATDAPPPRLRTMSDEGKAGRGTGRGHKPPARKLLRRIKTTGKAGKKRADFIKFIGGRETTIASLMSQFGMTRPNVNGFLTNIQRDHGIGYDKDNATVKLLLPPGSTWSNIWE